MLQNQYCVLKSAIFFIAACALSTSHASQQCLIVGVPDGDTLKARCGTPEVYEQVKIRLSEIDAPESKQAFGERSKQSLSDLCFQQQAVITGGKKDKYGRTLARVSCKGQDAALYQAQRGMAWAYTQYLTDPAIKSAEGAARAGRAGLWADTAPVAPWAWRQETKTATVQPVQAGSGTCHTGPRGGTYTITSSGRKDYSGC